MNDFPSENKGVPFDESLDTRVVTKRQFDKIAAERA
jgi:hypothetical protein